MGLVYLPNTPEDKRFSPRVDKQSLKLKSSPYDSGENVAAIEDTYMSDNEVVLWDGGNNRFKTTGVSKSELDRINGSIAGNAAYSKAVVLDSQGKVSGIESLTSSELHSQRTFGGTNDKGYIDDSKVYHSSLIHSEGDLLVGGNVEDTLTFNSSLNNYIVDNDSRVVIRRSSDDMLMFGDVHESTRLVAVSENDVYVFDGRNDYKIWNEGNQGHGTGMNADKLDGEHLSQVKYTDADNYVYNEGIGKIVNGRIYDVNNDDGSPQKRTEDEWFDFLNTGVDEEDSILVVGMIVDTDGEKWVTSYAIKKSGYFKLYCMKPSDGSWTVFDLYDGITTYVTNHAIVAI